MLNGPVMIDINSSLKDHLFGDRDPKEVLKRERPLHRRIADLALQGLTSTEISQMVGIGKHRVNVVLRQPFIREYMIRKSQETVSDAIKEFLEKETLPSLQVLKELRDNGPPTQRLAAATALLDRALGRPTQRVENEIKGKQLNELTNEELERLIREYS